MAGILGGCQALRRLLTVVVLVGLAWHDCTAFSLLGEAPVNFCSVETRAKYESNASESAIENHCQSLVQLYVNRLNTVKTVIPYAYESFDFCKGEALEADPMVENIGQVLLGDRITTSPYIFTFNQTQECVTVCEKTYNPDVDNHMQELDFLQQAIRLSYQNHWIVDNLPVTWCFNVHEEGSDDQRYCSAQLPIGCYIDKQGINEDFCFSYASSAEKDTYYFFNYINITITYNQLYEDSSIGRIVSIQMQPDSINHQKNGGNCQINPSQNNPDSFRMAIPAELKEPMSIRYTYSVEFVLNEDLRWQSRWEYVLGSMGKPHNKIFYLSTINSLVIAGFLLLIVGRILHHNVYPGEESVKKAGSERARDFRWKLLHGDIFRPPRGCMLLSALLGSGTQIVLVAFITLAFGGEKWKTNLLLTGLLVPSIIVAIVLILNVLLWTWQSSAAIPTSTLLTLLALWFGIQLPLVYIGGFIDFIRKPIEFPVPTNLTQRRIPRQPCNKHPVLTAVFSGGLPFSCIFIQLFFILSSIWMHQFFYGFGFTLCTAAVMVVVCSLITILFCFLHLQSENYHWWWRSFLSSGFTAVYVLIYCVYYFVSKLTIQGTASTVLYFGYTSIMVLLFFLFTGTIGLFSCFWFLLKIYSSLDPSQLELNSDVEDEKDMPQETMNVGVVKEEEKEEDIANEAASNQEDGGNPPPIIEVGKDNADTVQQDVSVVGGKSEGELTPQI
ncbi:transmembrane 9 superfamily member 2-like isoform X2 [Patiria miniata]|uniref:Transmembrane 9 superfamily member n=1 Tax=Patiria miniata TaxID=46514 RepID=A0A913ZFI4_PATMI|nr:transmembrane 9 superfamily member 2-like isoform X2 [Patiria miniata]